MFLNNSSFLVWTGVLKICSKKSWRRGLVSSWKRRVDTLMWWKIPIISAFYNKIATNSQKKLIEKVKNCKICWIKKLEKIRRRMLFACGFFSFPVWISSTVRMITVLVASLEKKPTVVELAYFSVLPHPRYLEKSIQRFLSSLFCVFLRYILRI